MSDYSDPTGDTGTPASGSPTSESPSESDAPPTSDASSVPVAPQPPEAAPETTAPGPAPKKPVYKTWWFWAVTIVLIGALAYAVSLAAGDNAATTDGEGLGPGATGSETATSTPSEDATTGPKEPTPTTPGGSATGTESEARAFAPDITAVQGDVGVIQDIIAQMEVAGHGDYETEDEDNGEKHYVWTFDDGSKLVIVMVPASTGDNLAFERVDIED